jgi:hypothetical protein
MTKENEKKALAQGVICVSILSLVVLNTLVAATQDACRAAGVKHRLLGNLKNLS